MATIMQDIPATKIEGDDECAREFQAMIDTIDAAIFHRRIVEATDADIADDVIADLSSNVERVCDFLGWNN